MINKVEGPGSVRGPQQIKRTGRVGETAGASFSRSLEEASALGGVAGTSGASALTDVAAVLGAQEVDDAAARASKGKARGMDLLDRLDEIRLQLLTGQISRERLIALAQMVGTRRPQVSDPHLSAILDEIELRVRVELAKFESWTP